MAIIRDFRTGDEAAFRDINLEWITRHFVVEPKDLEALLDPHGAILDRGGAILIAEMDEVAAGCCALIPMPDRVVELAKMGVLENARGQGLGRRLVQAAIARARDMGARSLYLETNSKLVAAMKLYAAEGFVQARGRPSPYARADVQMELALCTG